MFLFLSLGALVFPNREAWAQQYPQEAQQHIEVSRHVVIDGEDTEQVSGTLHAENSQPATSDESTPPVDSVLPIYQYHLDMGSAPTPSAYGPLDRYELEVSLEPEPSAPEALAQYESETPVGSGLTAGENSWLEVVPASEPEPVSPDPISSEPVFPADPELAPLLDPAPEPVAFEENEPVPSWAEVPASIPVGPDTGQEELPLLSSSLGTVVSSAADTFEGAANVLASFADEALFRSAAEDEGSIGGALTNLFSRGEPDPASTVEGSAENPGSSSGGTESPRKDTPRPYSPFMPPPVGSGYFSLSGGELGPGGVAPLLLCVLVSVSILLRWEGRISWAFCHFSKPSSALLLPLERPG